MLCVLDEVPWHTAIGTGRSGGSMQAVHRTGTNRVNSSVSVYGPIVVAPVSMTLG